jgi:hypothetical protein
MNKITNLKLQQHNASAYDNGDAYGDESSLVALNPACFEDVVLK